MRSLLTQLPEREGERTLAMNIYISHRITHCVMMLVMNPGLGDARQAHHQYLCASIAQPGICYTYSISNMKGKTAPQVKELTTEQSPGTHRVEGAS